MIRNINKCLVALAVGLALFASGFPSSARGAGALQARAYLPALSANGNCAMNAQESAILTSMRSDSRQMRPQLVCSPALRQAAYFHAQDMVNRNYFDHSTPQPNSIGPNQMARNAGYVLPTFYNGSSTGNNIESIAGGFATASSVWSGWMGSPGHQNHLLGLLPFYAEQIDFGIAYIYDANSTYRHYWVVMTARKGP